MPTRSDQLHSHQFALQRLVAAVALRDPDASTSPLRRGGAALLAGAMVAALGLAAFGIYGLLRPGGGDRWRDGGSVIIERESGARFVFRDGVLHPVVNYSSALLILGAPNPPSTQVARAALLGVPRGVPLGIPGAPDLLPAPQDLLPAPWTVCSRRPDRPAPGSFMAESVLLIGSGAAATEPLGARGLLARDANGALHLLWNARRYPVTAEHLLQPAFGWSPHAALPVATAVLNAVPAGGEIGRVSVDRGAGASAIAGYRVGEVFVVQTAAGRRTFGVAQSDGLADITQVQADLLLADGANGPGGRASEMGQALYASSPHAPSLVPGGATAPPDITPDLARVDGPAGLCAAYGDGAATPDLVLSSAPRTGAEVRPAAVPGDLTAPVDWAAVPPGRGALVEALAGPTATEGPLAVVSDMGQRFPLANREVLVPLGYALLRPVRLPAAVVALLPASRTLDPAAALTPA